MSRELRIHPVISQILINRSISNPEDARKYLSPSLSELHNPFLMKDMKKGVERVIKAVHDREAIVIYGDYDVDGVTSVAILYRFLKRLNVKVSYRIPDRFQEGYSLNLKAVDEIKSRGASLIITVDCGISDHEQIKYARSLGMDCIVLDHHEIPETLPDAWAVIDTNRSDCRFPFKHLAGVGIVFNFLIALRGMLREQGYWTDKTYPNLRAYLDLVALGTIGDISPLVDENRIFAKIGLDLINEGRCLGLQALKEISGLQNQAVDSAAASFSLIPRINAAGRVASADEALRLLLTDNWSEATAIAKKLDAYNRERQAMERRILNEILDEINAGAIDIDRSLVFASEDWHPGVIGIVASRLVDLFYRPAILISLKDGIGKGSGRSISEFNLHDGLCKCQSLLLNHGGHRYAAGISIKEEDIADFKLLLNEVIKKDIGMEELLPQTFIDAQCGLGEIKSDLLSQIQMLAPFGSRNPEPVLFVKNVQIGSSSVVGNNHLAMRVSAPDGTVCSSIWFNKGHLSETVTGSLADIAFIPQYNHWNGSTSLQLKMKDMAVSAS